MSAERHLVTGAGGFIGKHLVNALEAYSLMVGRLDLVFEGVDFDRLYTFDTDLRDQAPTERVFQHYKPTTVWHLAAYASVREGMEKPLEYIENNIKATMNVLLAAAKAGAKTVVFASSGGTVYGEPYQVPVPADHYTKPVDVYGTTKLAGEHLVRIQCEHYGMDWYNLRFPNVYGPGQTASGEAGVATKFIASMRKGDPPTIHGDGLQTRDFMYVKDVVRMSRMIVSTLPSGSYNVGTGKETSVMEIFNCLSCLLGFDKPPVHVDPKPNEVGRISLVPAVQMDPVMSLEGGLRRTVESLT